MTEMSEASENEAIEMDLYIEHCGELPYDFVDSDNQTNSPLNVPADQMVSFP
jgi:N-methylhydantoinase B/oxoprolinase/acetone carboxylase alpha subunit